MQHLQHFLNSPLVNLNFAGFRANSLELQDHGWALSAHEIMCNTRGRRELQIMLNHDKGGLTMISQLELLDYQYIMSVMQNGRHDLPEFNVVGFQVGGRSHFMPHVRSMDVDFSFHKKPWAAIDATPMYEQVDLTKIDLNNFGVFKKLNDSANIFLPEKTINELMDEILTKQGPKQREIRQSQRREAFMQEFNRRPNEEIKVQLVAI